MEQIRKKRGIFLTVWLILLPIANTVILLLSLIVFAVYEGIFRTTSGLIFTLAIVPILNIVFSIAVWKWKRWGVFGLGVMSIAASAISGLSFHFLHLAPIGIVGIIVLAILVRPVWKHLEWR